MPSMRIVIGPAFPTSGGDTSALGAQIKDDREKSRGVGTAKTITLITVDDLARLIRLRPVKQNRPSEAPRAVPGVQSSR